MTKFLMARDYRFGTRLVLPVQFVVTARDEEAALDVGNQEAALAVQDLALMLGARPGTAVPVGDAYVEKTLDRDYRGEPAELEDDESVLVPMDLSGLSASDIW